MLWMTIAVLAAGYQGAPRVSVVVPRVRVSVDLDRGDDAEGDGVAGTTDTTIAVRRGTRLAVDNYSGRITVVAWDQDKVRIRTGAGDKDGVEVSGGLVTLRVRGAGSDDGDQEDHDISISAPAWMELDLSGNEADIEVRAMRAGVRVETVEGAVALEGGEGNISLRTVDGDIRISGAKGRVELSTVEGAVRASDITGDLDVGSVDGGIVLERVASRALTASTVDGNIRFSGPLLAEGAYHLESHDGNVTVEPDGEPDAVITISTFDGEFVSDWPVTVTGANSNRRMTFTLGAGKARVELETFDGTIALRRGASR